MTLMRLHGYIIIRSVVFIVSNKTNNKDVKRMRKQVQLHELFLNNPCPDVHMATTFP
jgi:hypothetical protein